MINCFFCGCRKLLSRFSCLFILLSIVFCGAVEPTPAYSSPLVVPGKKTLFQRVISHPDATLYKTPYAGAEALFKPKTFTPFYVFERKVVEGSNWLAVGRSSTRLVEGWMLAAKTSSWNQALTLKFSKRAGRDVVAFYNDKKALSNIAESPSVRTKVQGDISTFNRYLKNCETPPSNYPVLALEPSEGAVAQDRFYLMPIFDMVSPYEGVKFLEVGSVDAPETAKSHLVKPRAEIVFIIDTTISMGPYIKKVQDVVRAMYDRIEQEGLVDDVAFALVGYRNSTEYNSALEYVSRVFSDFKTLAHRSDFESQMKQMTEAKVSTHSFAEDAFAGIQTAVNRLNWSPDSSRLIILITDAGPLQNSDKYSSTGMNEHEIADLAHAHGISIYVIHLQTVAGKRNFPSAKKQYKVLSAQKDSKLKSMYAPINTDRPDRGLKYFEKAAKVFPIAITKFVRQAKNGKVPIAPREVSSNNVSVGEQLESQAERFGYALHLALLGRQKKLAAPQVLKAWVADTDMSRLESGEYSPAFEVCVLLTKNQLSDLQQRLRGFYEEAVRSHDTGSKDFFKSILTSSTLATRDPVELQRGKNLTIKDMGVMSEFLEDLPYKSDIMLLTEDDWYRMSSGEQKDFLNRLKSRIARYQEYHDNEANWETFGSQSQNEAVIRIPLAMLP